MPENSPTPAHRAVFLSYASQDAAAATRICEALRAAGVEVWFDQSELVGGDAWDAKIRGQIGSCALFVPVISAATQARGEGYFRLEWKLAVDRSHLMAHDQPFLLPVVIDATADAAARVPPEFRSVQWTKLPQGETPPAFVARVQKLLGGDAVGGALRPDSAEPSGRKAPPTVKPFRLWLIPAILGAAALVGLALWQPWKKSAPTAPAAIAAAPRTPAQELVAQARKIYEEGDELDRENLFLAEDLVKRALALDSAEPSAWELTAWLSYNMVWQSIDNSGARRDLLMRQATRARTLAPQSVSAQLVLLYARLALNFALSAVAQSNDLPEIERELTALAQQEPANWQIQRALGTTLRLLNRPDDSIRAMQRAVELSGGNVAVTGDLVNILMRRSRYAEAEALVAPALIRRATGRMLTFDLYFKLLWRGDQAAAQAALTAWPGWLMQEDRGAFYAWRTWMFARQPEKALALVQRLQRDYLHDANFTGPRAVLSARAHELAGHTDAAAADWRTVAQLADRELALTPDDSAAAYWKAWALARLGDIPGARTLGNQLQQRSVASLTSFHKSTSMAPLWVVLGQTDQAFTVMGTKSETYNDTLPVTRAMLELDPAYDALRPDPRFKAILEQALAPEKPRTEDGGRITAPPVDDKSVAVLAFANLSDDKANEYFSDGISEELLNVLAKVPGLKVSARTSAFYFKGKEVPVPEIARQLGVAYVVEGSVRKAGDKVRITAQLIKADGGFHVWSDTFTRDLKDIFAVQDEIAGLVAKNLQLKMGITSPESRREVNPQAHQLLLEGRHYLTLRTATGFDQAESAFSQALKIDPQFAQAQAGLAITTALRGRYRILDGVGRVEEFDQLAITQSRLALQMDPSLAEPHAAIGFIYTDNRQLGDAEQEFQLAFAANPNYATAYHWHSHVLALQGRLDLALKEIARATTLDPLSFIMALIQGFYTCDSQRYAEALAILDRAASLRSETFLPLESDRARMLLALGRPADALAVARKVLRDPRLITAGWYAAGEALQVLQRCGEPAEATRLAESLIPAMPPGSYQRGYALCALGNFREGLPQLATMPVIVQNRIYWHPLFDPVRDTPEFQQLLVKLNCVEQYKVARATLARMLKEPEAKK